VGEHLKALWSVTLNGPTWRAWPPNSVNGGPSTGTSNVALLAGFFIFLERRLFCGNEANAVFYDSTHYRVHQHANGLGTAENQAIGKSKGGPNTKLHVTINATGWLAAGVILTPEKISDHTVASELTADLRDTAGLGDKGCDTKRKRD
jgi:hypothetical protein